MLSLIELLSASTESVHASADISNLTVRGITLDSREVSPGFLFVAVKGQEADGAAYAAKAQDAGAVAVLCARDAALPSLNVPVLRCESPGRVLAQCAARWFAPQPSCMVAITGTDGKTSTADFCRQLWAGIGHGSASVGTLGIISGTGEVLSPGTHTTPQPLVLHRALQQLQKSGIEHAAMEASSHGLHQHRLDGVQLKAAAFTNFGRDHLDYHQTVEQYFLAKLRLFSELLPVGATAVLNRDDARFDQVAEVCRARGCTVVDFGQAARDLKLHAFTPLPHGGIADVELFGARRILEIPVVGGFQTLNILTALGLLLATGSMLEKLLDAVPGLHGVAGRLEQVARLSCGATVFIDYAHTPLALANILRTLRPHVQGRLHVVFGCGGNRDAGKRPEMGRIATQLADVVIVTDDNPRKESPEMIRRAILQAAPGAKEVADRREAIYGAMKGLRSGDILVIAGKGHEKTQTVGDNIMPFDDAAVAREAAEQIGKAA